MAKKVLLVLALVAVFLIMTSSVAVAQGPPLPKDLQCKGAVNLDRLVPGHGVVTISDVDTNTDSLDGDDIRALTVSVAHGPTTSSHDIFYEDNDDSGSLTCGDTILAIT